MSSHASAAPVDKHETSRSVDDAIRRALPEKQLEINQSGAAAMPECRTPLKVSVLRSGDPGIGTASVQCLGPSWTLYVGFRSEIMIEAPVITREVQAGQAIGPNDFAIRDVSADLVASKRIPPGVLGQGGVIASLNLHPGEYISYNDASIPPVIRSGEHISVTESDPRAGLTLTTTAITLENGGIGEMIEVENGHSHRRFDARIVRSIPETRGVFVVAPQE